MQPRSYLHVVRVSGGWAVCCERCQTTIAVASTPDDADAIITTHTCTTPSREVRR
jgi:hypothetical protein